MPATPLQEIETSVHEQFGAQPPTKEEAGELIIKKFPTMDGGIAIAIAIAALVLQGWSVYRAEQERRERLAGSGGPKKCPECGEPALSKNAAGKSVCVNKHTW